MGCQANNSDKIQTVKAKAVVESNNVYLLMYFT